MPDWLLALNVGSSSVKFAAYPPLRAPNFCVGQCPTSTTTPQLTLARRRTHSTTPCGELVTDLRGAIDRAIDVVFSLLDPEAGRCGTSHRSRRR